VAAGAFGPATRRVMTRALRGVRWYVTTLLGDHDYERYVAHLARVHPEATPESLREYWRSRHAGAAAQARCC